MKKFHIAMTILVLVVFGTLALVGGTSDEQPVVAEPQQPGYSLK